MTSTRICLWGLGKQKTIIYYKEWQKLSSERLQKSIFRLMRTDLKGWDIKITETDEKLTIYLYKGSNYMPMFGTDEELEDTYYEFYESTVALKHNLGFRFKSKKDIQAKKIFDSSGVLLLGKKGISMDIHSLSSKNKPPRGRSPYYIKSVFDWEETNNGYYIAKMTSYWSGDNSKSFEHIIELKIDPKHKKLESREPNIKIGTILYSTDISYTFYEVISRTDRMLKMKRLKTKYEDKRRVSGPTRGVPIRGEHWGNDVITIKLPSSGKPKYRGDFLHIWDNKWG